MHVLCIVLYCTFRHCKPDVCHVGIIMGCVGDIKEKGVRVRNRSRKGPKSGLNKRGPFRIDWDQ